jgi:molybdate transport system regulatory protein
MSIKVDIKVRLLCGAEIAMGPGKADLLDAIGQTGSISAAARRMDMSYRRAWLLVDVMNRAFRDPLVSSAVGGQKGGGAHLTDTGLAVLAQFRGVEAAAEAAARAGMAQLSAFLLDEPAPGKAGAGAGVGTSAAPAPAAPSRAEVAPQAASEAAPEPD